jgi:hypothetical protein
MIQQIFRARHHTLRHPWVALSARLRPALAAKARSLLISLCHSVFPADNMIVI